MHPWQTFAAPAEGKRQSGVARKQRQHPRHPVSSLAYVRLDHANGGIIRNLSESGMAIQAVRRLHPEQVVHVRFELLKPRVRIEGTGQVVWADSSGQAGLRLLDLSARCLRLLKEWLLTDLLIVGSESSPSCTPIFRCTGREAECEDGLILSSAPVPAIRLENPDRVRAEPEPQILDDHGFAQPPLKLSWWPTPITPRALGRLIDSLIVMAAVLLFAIVFVATAGTFPSRLVAIGLLAGVTCLFGLMYAYLFTTFSGATPGSTLAQLAAEDLHWSRSAEEDVPRFR